jgi:bifunctional NMN adenylyltransferase/nudix hydrolase
LDYKAAIFIGRFQPFHSAHLDVLRRGLQIAEQVIVIVGSYNAAPNIKNPWSLDERDEMIMGALTETEQRRVNIVGVRDYFNQDNAWIRDIQNKVAQRTEPGDSVCLIGHYKDASSYYFKSFPQWEFIPCKSTRDLNATDIRKAMFTEGKVPSDSVPPNVHKFLSEFMYGDGKHFSGGNGPGFTAKQNQMWSEYKYIQDYKKSWEGTPYPVTFVTADALVVCSGHVLVIKRRINPGAGLLALPGGFLRAGERFQDGALRELKEETGIRVDKLILENSIVDSHIFDHPDRSLRGRVITNAFCIKLKDGVLPEVKGNDDAERALWVPLMDVQARESEFFEDHAHIISYFLNRI